jgi:hypothetical protein
MARQITADSSVSLSYCGLCPPREILHKHCLAPNCNHFHLTLSFDFRLICPSRAIVLTLLIISNMPVLSEPATNGTAILPDISVTYVFLGAFLLVLLGIYISRRTKPSQVSIMAPFSQEKEPLLHNQNTNNPSPESQSASPMSEAQPRMPRPPRPIPFTPPMPAQTDLNFSSYESFEPVMEMPPRRRSYTKTMTDRTEVSGEIIVAEGWRRHTRVFGGGVCKACEESEMRMSA